MTHRPTAHRFATGLLATLALGLTATTSGCGGDSRGPALDGVLGLELHAAPGVEMGNVAFAISGNGFSKIGTLNAASSTDISGRIGGIPQGSGFLVALTANASNDGGIRCEGSANFSIVAGTISMAAVKLQCRLPPRTGTVLVDGTVPVCPIIDAVNVLPPETTVGGSYDLSAVAVDVDGAPSALTYAWTSTVGTVANPAASSTSATCSTPGAGTLTLRVSDGNCTDTVSVPVVCTAANQPPTPDAAAPPSPPTIKVNEVESSGGVPGDWAELFNHGAAPVDVSGWVFKDNDDTHMVTIAPGTTIAPGSYLVLETGSTGFGLGSGDSARLFTTTGTLVDTYTWTAHAAITYGRCPNGTGAFTTAVTSTRGAANDCPAPPRVEAGAPPQVDAGAPPSPAAAVVTLEPWPGSAVVTETDSLNQFGANLSGLTYQAAAGGSPAVLWGVLNSPSLLYRMLWNGSTWTFDAADSWGAGKAIRYPDGTGNPDCESVTRAESGSRFMYIATERNTDSSSVSRVSILRVDASTPGAVLTTANEWNLNADLPVVGPNQGLEAITWIPDSYLTANGLLDQTTGLPYNPASYADHGTGLFFVGVEGTGMIHAYALNHATSAFTRIASIASEHPAVMSLEFDRETGALWAGCDNTCGNQQHVLGVVGGTFVVRRKFDRPAGLPDSNNEGVAMATEAECVGGFKAMFWADDSHFAGHALRTGSIPCGPLF